MFPIHPWFCPMQEWMWWWQLQVDCYTSMRREPSIWTESPIWWWMRQAASCKAPWRRNSGRYIHSLLQVSLGTVVYSSMHLHQVKGRYVRIWTLQFQFLLYSAKCWCFAVVCVCVCENPDNMHCLGDSKYLVSYPMPLKSTSSLMRIILNVHNGTILQ